MDGETSFRDVVLFVIVLSCVIPSAASSASTASAVITLRPTIAHLCLAAFAVLLICVYGKEYRGAENRSWIIASGAGLTAFGVMCVSSAVISVAGRTYRQELPVMGGAATWVSAISAFVLGAIYEEAVYRFYLPEVFRRIAPSAVAEAGAVLLFTLAHKRAGALAVCNAAAGGMALRACFQKSHSLIATSAAHIAYNILQLFLAASV